MRLGRLIVVVVIVINDDQNAEKNGPGFFPFHLTLLIHPGRAVKLFLFVAQSPITLSKKSTWRRNELTEILNMQAKSQP